jgi:hypothetical protein
MTIKILDDFPNKIHKIILNLLNVSLLVVGAPVKKIVTALVM